MSYGNLAEVQDGVRASRAEPTREYISGGSRRPLYGYGYGTIGSAALDAEACGGPALWEQMMMNPYVSAGVRVLIAGILADGVQPACCIAEDDKRATKAEKARADEICMAVADAMTRMPCGYMGDFKQILRCALVNGTGLAEKVYSEITQGPYKGKLGFARIKPKPIESWYFQVDSRANVLGVGGWVSDGSSSVAGTRVIPREKFAALAWDAQDGRPVGRSALRQAQPAWNMYVQIRPVEWDFVETYANPSTVGECGPNMQDQPERDADGNIVPGKILAPVKQMENALVGLQGGSVIAIPSGAKVSLLQPQGDGMVFDRTLQSLAREIAFAILCSARVNMEAENSSKSDGSIAQDLFWLVCKLGRQDFASMVKADIYRPFVELNFGEADAAEFCPDAIMGSTAAEDFSRNAGAIARLFTSGAMDQRDRPQAMHFLFGGTYDPPMGPIPQDPNMPQNPQQQQDSGNPTSPANKNAA